MGKNMQALEENAELIIEDLISNNIEDLVDFMKNINLVFSRVCEEWKLRKIVILLQNKNNFKKVSLRTCFFYLYVLYFIRSKK